MTCSRALERAILCLSLEGSPREQYFQQSQTPFPHDTSFLGRSILKEKFTVIFPPSAVDTISQQFPLPPVSTSPFLV